MDTLIRDLRYAVRTLLREPGFTLLAILALALGIGATTAIFTVVDSVLLRPLPYKDPDRLVVTLLGPTASGPISPADYLDYKRDAQSFARLGAAQAWGATLSEGDRPERLRGLQVSTDLFEVLGVPALVGRTFAVGDDDPGGNQVIVLSHALWQRRFGADRAIVGRSISIEGRPYTVVGVMPPDFRFAPFWATRTELWAPLSLARRLDDRGGRSLRLFARLKDGVTVSQAQAEMTAISARLASAYPQTNTGIAVTVRPLLDKVVSGIRPTLLAMMAMVTFVLLIACANVANTLLARASGRRREIVLRAAIGATRGQVVRQLLTESVLLATTGAAGGIVLAVWGVKWLLAMLPAGSLPRQQEIGFDPQVLGAALIATMVAGVVTGLVPALQVLETSLVGAFQDGSKGVTEGSGRKRVRSALVVAEVTLALVLLAGAGLMARTMVTLSAVDPGFAIDRVAIATVSLAGTPHAAPAARLPMFRRVREQFAALPGVTAVSAINHLPLAGDLWNLGYTIDGRPVPGPGDRLSAVYRIVEPGYFSAVGQSILSGREIADVDTEGSVPVAVINKAMADRRWPGEDPVGRRIHLPGPSEVQAPITIVGVAANARQGDWTSAPDDEVYLAFSQRSSEFGLATLTFVLRTAVDPARIAAAIPGTVAQLDRTVPAPEITTMEAVVGEELWRERLTAQLTWIFAGIALGLAAIGVYAVVAYSVTRRTREFGVRVALGGTRRSLMRLALIEALTPVAIGATLGVVIAIASARLTQTLLYEVSPLDPLALGGAVLSLLIVGAAAAWIPARRASRLDPLTALRHE
jgi:putative ABC transport system permease protein